MRFSIFLAMGVLVSFPSLAQTVPTKLPPTANAAASAVPTFEAIAGHYRFDSGVIMSVEHTAQTLFVKSTGQPQQSLTVSADGHFNYSAIPAYLTFDVDKTGQATKLHFHYDERSMAAKRIDAAVAKRTNDALDLKIKNQTHDPACAVTLKRIIEETRAGKPDYSKMMLYLAQAMRSQLPMAQQKFQGLGAVKEVKFIGVAPMGAEQFDVSFDNGASQAQIFCLPNGYVSAVGFR
jgi:hypothetical protein